MIAALMLMAALPPKDGINIFGMGSVSCATAWQPENDQATQEWLLGFWSGRNFEGTPSVGHLTDRAGVVAEVRLECQREPSKPVITATIRVYNRMAAAGR